jgi:hypothetical protein
VVDTADGVLIGTEDEIEALVRQQFRQNESVVDQLIADRRRQAKADRA